jgi:hypothetical protein
VVAEMVAEVVAEEAVAEEVEVGVAAAGVLE